ncbi:MAG TPA: hypothetical protein VM307_01565, partial [Egibacteraceae bacterium]|nr:hypothetical protein [Egibacteraceae bacterium]
EAPQEPAPARVSAPAAPEAPAPAATETSQEPPPPDAPADTGDAAIDLELVQRSWDALLEAVKARKRSLQAWLLMARPVWLRGTTLGLEFRSGYAFHADNCAREDSQELLGEIFEQLLGVPLRVDCTVADGGPAPSPVADDSASLEEQAQAVLESEAAVAAGDVPDDDEAHAQALKTLERDLGAVVVDEQQPSSRHRP